MYTIRYMKITICTVLYKLSTKCGICCFKFPLPQNCFNFCGWYPIGISKPSINLLYDTEYPKEFFGKPPYGDLIVLTIISCRRWTSRFTTKVDLFAVRESTELVGESIVTFSWVVYLWCDSPDLLRSNLLISLAIWIFLSLIDFFKALMVCSIILNFSSTSVLSTFKELTFIEIQESVQFLI